MAALALTKVFINLTATGQAISAASAPGRLNDFEVPGESRLYAGGRRRAITSTGQVATYTCVLLLVSTADRDTLRSWAGQAVQIRDNLGNRNFGIYRKVPAAEVRGRPGRWNVTIALDVLTIAEGV